MDTLHAHTGWKPGATNSDDVDREHLKLIDLSNRLHEGLRKGDDERALSRIYNILVHHARRHFAEEERSMLACSYPHYWQHKREHEQLLSRVVDIQNRLYNGQAKFSIELVYLLRHWFTHHVFGADRAFDGFVSEKSA